MNSENLHLRSLRALVWSQGRRYLAAVLVEGVATAFLFTAPWLSMLALDVLQGKALPGESPAVVPTAVIGWLEGASTTGTLWRIAGAIGLCSLVAGMLLFARVLLASTASERIVRTLRGRLYAQIERLPMTWHDSVETGDVVQRCSSDVETVRLFLSTQIVEIGRAVILLALLVPVLVTLDRSMALVALALFPLIVGSALYFFRVVRAQFQEMDEAEGRMTSVLQDNLTGIRVVRAFARQEFECEKFSAASGDFRDKNHKFINSLATFFCLSDLLCFAQLGLVVLVAAYRVQAGSLSLGVFFAIYSYVWIAIWPIRHMGRVLADAGKALVAMERIRGVLLALPESQAEPSSMRAVEAEVRPVLQGRIEFEHVSFGYTPEALVLRDISFRLEAGQTLALVGPPGAGKSTLIRVLCKLYEGYSGSIRLDGQELRDLPHAHVRSAVACALQQPFVFAKSVEANLALGLPEHTREELEPAARKAALHDSIVEFEEGYATLLGERGVTLSGGQRGRLAIARALAKPAAILVLDDSLSAVDAHTEEAILDALQADETQRSKILIAHRISALRDADLILVMVGGEIIQRGTHDELSRQEGHYARLVRLQGHEHSTQKV